VLQIKVIAGSFSDHRLLVLSARSQFDIFMSTQTRCVITGGDFVMLTEAEFAIFFMLAARVGTIVSRGDLIDMLYGDDPEGGPDCAFQLISKFIRRIIRKIDGFKFVDIKKEWGRGYYLEITAPQYLREVA
jgi:DNA-binding response OmpR family regulator